jgi:hypothetical protein
MAPSHTFSFIFISSELFITLMTQSRRRMKKAAEKRREKGRSRLQLLVLCFDFLFTFKTRLKQTRNAPQEEETFFTR